MGFDTERLALRGRLAEKEAEVRRLAVSIEGDINGIRALLPPFADLTQIKAEQAAVQAVEMAGKHAEYLGLLAEISNMKKALGLP